MFIFLVDKSLKAWAREGHITILSQSTGQSWSPPRYMGGDTDLIFIPFLNGTSVQKSVVISNLPQTFKPGRLFHLCKWECLTWCIRFPESEAYLCSGKGNSIMERRACFSGMCAGCVGWTRCTPKTLLQCWHSWMKPQCQTGVGVGGSHRDSVKPQRAVGFTEGKKLRSATQSYSLPPFSLHTS